MLIKDLLPISRKLYEAALDYQSKKHVNVDPNLLLGGSFIWAETKEGDSFWRAIDYNNLDSARAIDKENGWGLFEDDKPRFEVGGYVRILKTDYPELEDFRVGNVLKIARMYGKGCDLIGSDEDGEQIKLSFYFYEIEPADKPEEAVTGKKAKQIKPMRFDWEATKGFNKSAINDGLPSDYTPPQVEPRKAISFLPNDEQRERANDLWRRIKRTKHV